MEQSFFSIIDPHILMLPSFAHKHLFSTLYKHYKQEQGMIRRLIILSLISALFTVSHAGSLDDLYESLMEKKKEQISEALDLEDNSAFWEVYDDFQAKQSEYDIDSFKLIEKFHGKQESGEINEQSMINMQAEFFRIEGRKLQNKQNFAEFFGKALSKEQMFIFYEVEAKLEALIRSKIAKKSPLLAPKVKL